MRVGARLGGWTAAIGRRYSSGDAAPILTRTPVRLSGGVTPSEEPVSGCSPRAENCAVEWKEEVDQAVIHVSSMYRPGGCRVRVLIREQTAQAGRWTGGARPAAASWSVSIILVAIPASHQLGGRCALRRSDLWSLIRMRPEAASTGPRKQLHVSWKRSGVSDLVLANGAIAVGAVVAVGFAGLEAPSTRRALARLRPWRCGGAQNRRLGLSPRCCLLLARTSGGQKKPDKTRIHVSSMYQSLRGVAPVTRGCAGGVAIRASTYRMICSST